MSKRRKRNSFRPSKLTEMGGRLRHYPRHPETGRPRTVSQGLDASVVAMREALRGNGATDVAFGYSNPGEPIGLANAENRSPDPPPDVPVIWWWQATFHNDPLATHLAACDPTTDHAWGLLQAGANLIRQLGGSVTFKEKRP